MEGRQLYARGEWAEAEDAFARADAEHALGPEDVERWATTAYMLGRGDAYLERLQRCHDAHADAGDRRAAALSAFWIAITHVLAGRMGPGSGWLATAERLLEDEDDCVERAYLRVPGIFRLRAQGDPEGAAALCGEIVDAARRFGDRDLAALTGHTQGHMLVLVGRVEEGLRLLDEAMVAASSGRLSPIPTGLVYCGSIVGCSAACEVGRAHDWTEMLTSWCDAQPDMVAFTGTCRTHRAELLLLRGAWDAALDEALRAAARLDRIRDATVAAAADYVVGEVHRLRGDVAAAESAYRAADLGADEAQPGLALLRAAGGDTDGAVAMLARALDAATVAHRRARLLAAATEVHARRGDATAAAAASAELQVIGTALGTDLAHAMAAHAAALVDPSASTLRHAGALWRDLGATYECARVREQLGSAYLATGDEEGAAQEREAALDTYLRLGAAPDVARVEALLGRRRLAGEHGLSPRELEVLRLVAGGATNKAIAAELVLSERTVDRHVSNILAKLRVASRSAATAYAYEHRLL